MELKEYKTKVYNAVEKSYKIQEEYLKQEEDYEKKVKSQYLTRKFVDEQLNELKQRAIGILNETNKGLLAISREVMQTELKKIENSEESVTSDVYSELKLLSELKPTTELYQRYIDKYKNYPLAVDYIVELGTRDLNNFIFVNVPQDKRETLNILIQRLESYLTAFSSFSSDYILPQLELYANGVMQSINEDYQNYINLFE
jgi:hypothetical protein